MIRPRRRRNRSLVVALYVNAALLLAVLAVLVSRGGAGGSVAMAGPQMPPIAGGGGVFLMPAQFGMNSWGCYLMDIDAQTVCAYEFLPSQHQLRLVAARHYRYDRMLGRYNTSPSPEDVKRLVELEKNPLRGRDDPPAAPDANDAGPALPPPVQQPDPAPVPPGPAGEPSATEPAAPAVRGTGLPAGTPNPPASNGVR